MCHSSIAKRYVKVPFLQLLGYAAHEYGQETVDAPPSTPHASVLIKASRLIIRLPSNT